MSAADYIEDPPAEPARRERSWSPEPVASPPEPETAFPAVQQSARLTATIDIRQNRTMTYMTVLFGAVVVASFATLWLGHFSQTESVRGIVSVSGGVARLDAPRTGVVKEIFVAQGQFVDAGQPVYSIKVDAVSSGGEAAVETQLKTLKNARASLKAEMARTEEFIQRGRDMQASIAADQASLLAALDSSESAVKSALAKSDVEVQKVRDLVRQGYATRDLLTARERASFDLSRQLIDLRVRRIEYQRQFADKAREADMLLGEKQSQKVNADIQLQTTDAQIAALKIESGVVVQAQNPGFVLAIAAKVGDSVAAGQFVAALGDPNAEPLIEIDAPAQSVGLIKVGDSAILKYDAFPFKTFGVQHGVITAISGSPIKGADIRGMAGADLRPPEQRQSLYRVEIRPDARTVDAYGQKQPLKIGSTLTADLIVERRRLIDWVLDPIRALRGRT
jgi:membrane fusion protein